MIELRAAQHRQLHMRTDKEPFNDKRVRQAVALLINRDNIVKGLLEEKSDYGNDSPFAPVYPSTDTSVAQRKQDVEKAKALLAEAGKEQLQRRAARLERVRDAPVRRSCPERPQGGGHQRQAQHHRRRAATTATPCSASSPWLDSTFGITEYGHRGAPNVFLGAPLKSDGTWNSAHFKNKEYDALVDEYVAALDLQTPARGGEEDPGAAARRGADHLRLLLLLPDGDQAHGAPASTCRAMGHVDVSQAGQKA